MRKPDARTAIQNLALAFEHYNEHHRKRSIDHALALGCPLRQ